VVILPHNVVFINPIDRIHYSDQSGAQGITSHSVAIYKLGKLVYCEAKRNANLDSL